VAIKKSDVYPALWASCDELPGGMDASLCDMYVELTALEARLDKTSAPKQAMMEELLTGRIWLV
jgi:hypothetical protein